MSIEGEGKDHHHSQEAEGQWTVSSEKPRKKYIHEHTSGVLEEQSVHPLEAKIKSRLTPGLGARWHQFLIMAECHQNSVSKLYQETYG